MALNNDGSRLYIGTENADVSGVVVYDVKADWRVVPGQTDLAGGDPREPLRAAVFAALETELGLKLSPKKVPVRMIVIDSVEKASATSSRSSACSCRTVSTPSPSTCSSVRTSACSSPRSTPVTRRSQGQGLSRSVIAWSGR